MAEAKNTFIASKMNKDLDARLISNKEYRNAVNVAVSRSEEDSVGSLENILGNSYLTRFGLDEDCGIEIIGHCIDDVNQDIYVFLTNYTDSSASRLDNKIGELRAAFCGIGVYSSKENTGKIIVAGNFLNFSKTHYITGVNIVENLLFWTDDRNQPRKINAQTAQGDPWIENVSIGYYSSEDSVSVAKYYPHSPIDLYDGAGVFKDSTMVDKTSKFLPSHVCALVDSTSPTVAGSSLDLILVGNYLNIEIGDLISGKGLESFGGIPIVIAPTPSFAAGLTTIKLSSVIETPTYTPVATTYEPIIYAQKPNPDHELAWPGDPNYLEDRFVRFSYRFKFDDDEYSLMAPFTQECFVPQQDGYFIGDNAEEEDPGVGQEMAAVRSTIVGFMRNKIDDITLVINPPTKQGGQLVADRIIPFDEIFDKLKVVEIDILYKESDGTTIKVVDTLKKSDFEDPVSLSGDKLIYNYQSTKPWKTLPEKEITRVYDKVPIRALAQESAGNRIIYGNFIDKHTSPSHLDYTVEISLKSPLPDPGDFIDSASYVRKEYQNHTLKQNRNYQVGIVLSDRYGRQSDVILSKVRDIAAGVEKGSTIYHSYHSDNFNLIEDFTFSSPDDPTTWPGDMLNTIWYNEIPKTINVPGYPGLYSIADGTLIGYENLVDSGGWGALTSCSGTLEADGAPGVVWATVEFNTDGAGFINSDGLNITSGGDPGLYYQGMPLTLNSPCGGTATATAVTPIENPLGWYSYKVVVKQIEQDYYNCYLPGSLAGYPDNFDNPGGGPPAFWDPYIYPVNEETKTGHTVLLNDNINKIPRELKEVGPDQKQFGSGVVLYGRVENIMTGGGPSVSNKQYHPENNFHSAVTISTLVDLSLGSLSYDTTADDPKPGLPPFDNEGAMRFFYQGNTNPLIARIETTDKFGSDKGDEMQPFLSVYETKPVESNLDIFWETSTSGLISELNTAILEEDSTIATGIQNPQIFWSEANPAGTVISNNFTTLGVGGLPLAGCVITLDEVVVDRPAQDIVTNKFLLELVAPDTYRIKLTTTPYVHEFWYRDDSCIDCNDKNQYKFTLTSTRTVPGYGTTSITETFLGQLGNESPDYHLMYPTPSCIKERTWLSTMTMTPGSSEDNWAGGKGPTIDWSGGGYNTSETKVIVGATSQSWALPLTGFAPETWNGIFTAVNGAWKSDQPGFNDGVSKGQEIEWSIPRQYQVSCYQNTTNGALEMVFGYINGQGMPLGGNNAGGLSLPQGPIYRSHIANNTIDVEAYVGELYNNGKHYWPDLEYWSSGMASPLPNIKTLLMNNQPAGPGVGSYYSYTNGVVPISQLNTKFGFWEGATGGGACGVSYAGTGFTGNNVESGPGSWGPEFIVGCHPSSTSNISNTLNTTQCPDPSANSGAQASILVKAANSGKCWYEMPAGRYVVTLRATDCSGVGSGRRYVEWDVPIWIRPYKWGVCKNDLGQIDSQGRGCWTGGGWASQNKNAAHPITYWFRSSPGGFGTDTIPWEVLYNGGFPGNYDDYMLDYGFTPQYPPDVEPYPGGGLGC